MLTIGFFFNQRSWPVTCAHERFWQQ